MRLSSLVLGAVLVTTSAGSDELVWTSAGKVKSVRYELPERISFSASQFNLCGSTNDRYVINKHADYINIYMSLVLSSFENGHEVKIVAKECTKTDMGLAAEVEELMIVRP